MQGYAGDPHCLKPFDKHLGAVVFFDPRHARKQWAGFWKCLQERRGLRAKGDDDGNVRFVAPIGNGAVAPINVLGGQFRDVRLRAAQVPQELIIRPDFGIALTLDDLLVLFKCNRPAFLVLHGGPAAFRQHRPGQPVHPGGIVVQAAQKHVGGNRACGQHLHEML